MKKHDVTLSSSINKSKLKLHKSNACVQAFFKFVSIGNANKYNVESLSKTISICGWSLSVTKM